MAENQADRELAALRLALAAARWPLRLYDDYADNKAGWEVGEDEDDLSTTRQEVKGGKYRWQAQARDGFGWWLCAPVDNLGDFCLSVEVRQVPGEALAEYGVVYAGEENRLTVVGFGRHFVFLANEKVVGELDDGTLAHGKVGLLMGLEKAGDSAAVEFGRFELRGL